MVKTQSRRRLRKMKKLKKSCIIVFVVVVVFGLIGAIQSKAESQKPMELIHSSTYPETNPFSQMLKAYLTDMETYSNGKMKVKHHWAGSLGASKDQYDMVIDEICHFTSVPVGWMPGRFPLSEIPGLPIYGESSFQCSSSIGEVMKKGYLGKEHSEVKLILFATSAPQKLWSKKKISNIDDLKGLKIRASTKPEMAAVKAMGAVPTPLPVTEVYLALERGVVDATFADYLMSNQFKLYEAAPYVLELKFFAAPVVFIMNKDWWDKAPDDVKSAVLKATEEQTDKMIKPLDIVEGKLKGVCVKMGAKVIEFPEADKDKLKQRFQPIINDWVTKTEAKGYPAKDALKAYMDGLSKYKSGN